MKKNIFRLLVIAAILTAAVCAWFYGYHNRKNLDNVPSKELMLTYLREKGEDYASEAIRGYSIEGLRTVWGEPDGNLFGMFGYIWEVDGSYFVVYFDSDGLAEHVKPGERGDAA